MATEKRFVYYEHKGADYILDSPNKSLDFIEMLGDCLEEKEIVDLLNSLNDENGQLRKENDMLSCELSVSANKEISRNCRIAELEEENEQLKQENEKLQGEYDYLLWLYNGLGCEYDWLKDENEELKQRNNRQYEQLSQLYNLIEQKEWRVLTDIIDDFKKSDEQLQKEWRTYGDM